MAKDQMSLRTKLRLVGIVVLATLCVVVAVQNTQSVETRILWASVRMPRAVLLFSTAVLGFVAGVLSTLMMLRRHR